MEMNVYKIMKQGKEVLRIANNGPDFVIPREEWNVIANVNTMLSPPEKRLLWHLAKNSNADIANLGHANGGSAHVMGLALKHFNKPHIIHSIDFFKHTSHSTCVELIKQHGLSNIVLHRGLTFEVGETLLKDKSFNVVFIDAGHDHESVRRDWLAYSKLIDGPGAIVSFHDTNQIYTDNVINEYVDKEKWELAYHADRIKAFKSK